MNSLDEQAVNALLGKDLMERDTALFPEISYTDLFAKQSERVSPAIEATLVGESTPPFTKVSPSVETILTGESSRPKKREEEKPDAVTAAMRRVAEGMAARGTLSGASFSVSDKGTLELSYSSGKNSFATNPITNLTILADSVHKENDVDKKLSGLQSYQEAFARFVADTQAKTFEAADNKAGVSRLEKALLGEIAKDKAHPDYAAAGMRDSRATTEARQQLQQAKVESRVIADEMLRGNAEFQGITEASKFFIQKTGAEINRLYSAQDRAANREDARTIRKEDRAEREAAAGDLLDQSTLETMPVLYPQLRDASPADIYRFTKANPNKDRSLAISVSDKPEDLVHLSSLKNDTATLLAANKQASLVTGTTEGSAFEAARVSAAKDLAEMRKLSDPLNIEATIVKAFPPADAKKVLEDFRTQVSLKTGKDRADYLATVGPSYARAAMETVKRNQFYGEPLKAWSPGDVERLTKGSGAALSEALSLATKITPNPSMKNIVDQIVQLDEAKRTDALNEFKAISKSAMAKANAGIWTKVGSELDLNKIIDQAIVRKTLGKMLTGHVSDSLSAVDIGAAYNQSTLGVPSYLTNLADKTFNTPTDQLSEVLPNALIGRR